MSGEISIDHAQFREAVYDGLHDAVWNPLPKGSHVRYKGEKGVEVKGVEVFAFRHRQTYRLDNVVDVLTIRGDLLQLSEDTTLVQGGRK